MNANKTLFTRTVIAASFMAAYGTAWSADDDTVDELTKPSSEISIGVGGWNKDRQKLGVFDGMRKKDSYLLLDADVRKRDDVTGTWLNLSINNLGTDNREIRGEYLQQGNQGVAFEYTQFRFDAPFTINTNTTGIGTSLQNLGANIPNTAIGTGTNFQLGTKREKAGISFYKNLTPELDLNVKFSSEDKTGNRLSNNGNALFVADLIDHTTSKAEVTLNYYRDSLQVAGGYYGSWFRNNTVGYTAFGATLATATVMTQPLDNQAHQLFVGGSYRFTPTTKGTFKLAYSRGTQDEAIPTAGLVNGNIYGNLPSLNAKVDTTVLQFGLTAKPMPKLSVVANLRYYDRDDKTPLVGSVPNTGNGALLAQDNKPRSYTTTTGKLEGIYLLPQGYSATAGIDYNVKDRTVYTTLNGVAYNPYVPDRDKLREATYRLQLRKSLTESLNGSLAYLQSDRKGSGYTPNTQIGVATNSPVHIADRDRQKLRLAIDWAPVEKLDLQLVAETARDDYGSGERPEGLQDGRANLYSLDASYKLSDDWLVTGWYAYNTNDAHFNIRRNATVNYLHDQNDTGEALGLNLSGMVNAKTRLGAELSWSKDHTAFVQSQSDGLVTLPTSGGVTGVLAPDITSKVIKLNLFAEYALDKNAGLRFDVAYQKWQTNDWQWTYTNGLPWQYGTATDGTTVITTPTQSATFLSARYIYKFR